MKENEAKIVLRQILKGLEKIKERNIMHRDLKLPNVMLHFPELSNDILLD